MKLFEIKSGLIEQYFDENADGISSEKLEAVFESLGKSMNVDLSPASIQSIELNNQSSDPSKAFKRFTEGKMSILSISEEDGATQHSIFAAVRVGTTVKIANLTTSPIVEKAGDLSAVKHALRQSKNINEDVVFSISIVDHV